MKRLLGLVLWVGLMLLLVSCGQNGKILPTAVLQPIENILPTEAATTLPPTVMATDTAVPEATALPTLTTPAGQPVSQEEQLEQEAIEIEPVITILSPLAGDDVIVEQPLTIAGEIQPVPEVEVAVRIRILVVGGQELVSETAVVAEDGIWSLTTTIPPQIIGSAQLMVQLVGEPDAVAVQLNLLPSDEANVTTLRMNRPAIGNKVVAGYAVLFDGEVLQPLDDMVNMAIQSADCSESWTSNSITLENGRWQGWSVLPATVDAGAGCAIAFTGERGTESAREVRIPITILDELDGQARSLQLGNSDEQIMTAGASEYIYGIAIQAPNNQVDVRLMPDNLESSATPLAQGTAVVNSYGYWEINLDIPAETNPQQALLIITMGEDDTYREVRQLVFIQAPIVPNEAPETNE